MRAGARDEKTFERSHGGASSGSSATARPSAWSKPIGSMSNRVSPEGSVTTVGTASPSINGLATPASTGVTNPIQNEESHGVISGTGHPWPAAEFEDRGHAVEHLAVAQHVGAADLDLPPRRGLDRQRLARGSATCRRSRSAESRSSATPERSSPEAAARGSAACDRTHSAGRRPFRRGSRSAAGLPRGAASAVSCRLRRCWDCGRSPRPPR